MVANVVQIKVGGEEFGASPPEFGYDEEKQSGY